MSHPMNKKNIKKIYIVFFFLIIPFSLLSLPESGVAKEDIVTIGMDDGNAKITLLQGEAYLTRKGITKASPLKTHDLLMQGDTIRTSGSSRIEILLPDKSYIRFGENTQFILESASINPKKTVRDISVKIFFGKVWAKASKLFAGRGRFALSTRTAVAGVRGTVYRMNVNEDSSAVVKVYYGEVLVSSSSTEKSTKQESGPHSIQGPKPVSGPHPIPGPHAVSLKEWTHIVRSMQQIIIKPDGTASKPFRFSPEADEDEWVQWNKRRDEKSKDIDE
ncbi:MAG: hypothetical protein C0403_08990 [Desulfobacterium sp.]|nr:hypothetical protein [Desulfobacterium sp.]